MNYFLLKQKGFGVNKKVEKTCIDNLKESKKFKLNYVNDGGISINYIYKVMI